MEQNQFKSEKTNTALPFTQSFKNKSCKIWNIRKF